MAQCRTCRILGHCSECAGFIEICNGQRLFREYLIQSNQCFVDLRRSVTLARNAQAWGMHYVGEKNAESGDKESVPSITIVAWDLHLVWVWHFVFCSWESAPLLCDPSQIINHGLFGP